MQLNIFAEMANGSTGDMQVCVSLADLPFALPPLMKFCLKSLLGRNTKIP